MILSRKSILIRHTIFAKKLKKRPTVNRGYKLRLFLGTTFASALKILVVALALGVLVANSPRGLRLEKSAAKTAAVPTGAGACQYYTFSERNVGILLSSYLWLVF